MHGVVQLFDSIILLVHMLNGMAVSPLLAIRMHLLHCSARLEVGGDVSSHGRSILYIARFVHFMRCEQKFDLSVMDTTFRGVSNCVDERCFVL